jgi:hypothetical protein
MGALARKSKEWGVDLGAPGTRLFIFGRQTGTVWIDDFTVTKEAN